MDMTKLPFGKPAKRPRSKPTRAVRNPDGSIERIILSDTDWKKLTQWVWETQLEINGLVRCHIGAHTINEREQFVLDHVDGRGMNSGHRNDMRVKPACHWHNGEKGSIRGS